MSYKLAGIVAGSLALGLAGLTLLGKVVVERQLKQTPAKPQPAVQPKRPVAKARPAAYPLQGNWTLGKLSRDTVIPTECHDDATAAEWLLKQLNCPMVQVPGNPASPA